MLQDPSMAMQYSSGGFSPYQGYMTAPSAFKNSPVGFISSNQSLTRSQFGGALSNPMASEYGYMYESPVLAQAQSNEGILAGLSYKPLGQNSTMARMHKSVTDGIQRDSFSGALMSNGGSLLGGMAAGAALGSATGNPIGTFVGGVVGGIFGEMMMQPLVDSMTKNSIGVSSLQQNMMGLVNSESDFATGSGLSRKKARSLYSDIEVMAIEDGKMSASEIGNVFGAAIRSGNVASGADMSGMKKKIKEIKELSKTLGNIFGTSDIAEIFDNLKKIKSTGLTSAGATELSATISSYANKTGQNATQVLDQVLQRASMDTGKYGVNEADNTQRAGFLQNLFADMGLEGNDAKLAAEAANKTFTNIQSFTRTSIGRNFANAAGYVNSSQRAAIIESEIVLDFMDKHGIDKGTTSVERQKAMAKARLMISDEYMKSQWRPQEEEWMRDDKATRLEKRDRTYFGADYTTKKMMITGDGATAFVANLQKFMGDARQANSIIDSQGFEKFLENNPDHYAQSFVEGNFSSGTQVLKGIDLDTLIKAYHTNERKKELEEKNRNKDIKHKSVASLANRIGSMFDHFAGSFNEKMSKTNFSFITGYGKDQYAVNKRSVDSVRKKYGNMTLDEKLKYFQDISENETTSSVFSRKENIFANKDTRAEKMLNYLHKSSNGILVDDEVDNSRDAFYAAVGDNIKTQGIRYEKHQLSVASARSINAQDSQMEYGKKMRMFTDRKRAEIQSAINAFRNPTADMKNKMNSSGSVDDEVLAEQGGTVANLTSAFTGKSLLGNIEYKKERILAKLHGEEAAYAGVQSSFSRSGEMFLIMSSNRYKTDSEYREKHDTRWKKDKGLADIFQSVQDRGINAAKQYAAEKAGNTLDYLSVSKTFDRLFNTNYVSLNSDEMKKYGMLLEGRGETFGKKGRDLSSVEKERYSNALNVVMSDTGMSKASAMNVLAKKGTDIVTSSGTAALEYNARNEDVAGLNINVGSYISNPMLEDRNTRDAFRGFMSYSEKDQKIMLSKINEINRINKSGLLGGDKYDRYIKNSALTEGMSKEQQSIIGTISLIDGSDEFTFKDMNNFKSQIAGAESRADFEKIAGRKLTSKQLKGFETLEQLMVNSSEKDENGNYIKRFMTQEEFDSLGTYAKGTAKREFYERATKFKQDANGGSGVFNIGDIKAMYAQEAGIQDKSDAGLLKLLSGNPMSKTEALLEVIAKSNEAIARGITGKPTEKPVERTVGTGSIGKEQQNTEEIVIRNNKKFSKTLNSSGEQTQESKTSSTSATSGSKHNESGNEWTGSFVSITPLKIKKTGKRTSEEDSSESANIGRYSTRSQQVTIYTKDGSPNKKIKISRVKNYKNMFSFASGKDGNVTDFTQGEEKNRNLILKDGVSTDKFTDKMKVVSSVWGDITKRLTGDDAIITSGSEYEPKHKNGSKHNKGQAADFGLSMYAKGRTKKEADDLLNKGIEEFKESMSKLGIGGVEVGRENVHLHFEASDSKRKTRVKEWSIAGAKDGDGYQTMGADRDTSKYKKNVFKHVEARTVGKDLEYSNKYTEKINNKIRQVKSNKGGFGRNIYTNKSRKYLDGYISFHNVKKNNSSKSIVEPEHGSRKIFESNDLSKVMITFGDTRKKIDDLKEKVKADKEGTSNSTNFEKIANKKKLHKLNELYISSGQGTEDEARDFYENKYGKGSVKVDQKMLSWRDSKKDREEKLLRLKFEKGEGTEDEAIEYIKNNDIKGEALKDWKTRRFDRKKDDFKRGLGTAKEFKSFIKNAIENGDMSEEEIANFKAERKKYKDVQDKNGGVTKLHIKTSNESTDTKIENIFKKSTSTETNKDDIFTDISPSKKGKNKGTLFTDDDFSSRTKKNGDIKSVVKKDEKSIQAQMLDTLKQMLAKMGTKNVLGTKNNEIL